VAEDDHGGRLSGNIAGAVERHDGVNPGQSREQLQHQHAAPGGGSGIRAAAGSAPRTHHEELPLRWQPAGFRSHGYLTSIQARSERKRLLVRRPSGSRLGTFDPDSDMIRAAPGVNVIAYVRPWELTFRVIRRLTDCASCRPDSGQ
jgi:hypothetical protein